MVWIIFFLRQPHLMTRNSWNPSGSASAETEPNGGENIAEKYIYPATNMSSFKKNNDDNNNSADRYGRLSRDAPSFFSTRPNENLLPLFSLVLSCRNKSYSNRFWPFCPLALGSPKLIIKYTVYTYIHTLYGEGNELKQKPSLMK